MYKKLVTSQLVDCIRRGLFFAISTNTSVAGSDSYLLIYSHFKQNVITALNPT